MTRKEKLIKDFVEWGLVEENDSGKRDLTEKGQEIMNALVKGQPEGIGRRIIVGLVKETERRIGRPLTQDESVSTAFHFVKVLEVAIRNDKDDMEDTVFYPAFLTPDDDEDELELEEEEDDEDE